MIALTVLVIVLSVLVGRGEQRTDTLERRVTELSQDRGEELAEVEERQRLRLCGLLSLLPPDSETAPVLRQELGCPTP